MLTHIHAWMHTLTSTLTHAPTHSLSGTLSPTHSHTSTHPLTEWHSLTHTLSCECTHGEFTPPPLSFSDPQVPATAFSLQPKPAHHDKDHHAADCPSPNHPIPVQSPTPHHRCSPPRHHTQLSSAVSCYTSSERGTPKWWPAGLSALKDLPKPPSVEGGLLQRSCQAVSRPGCQR